MKNETEFLGELAEALGWSDWKTTGCIQLRRLDSGVEYIGIEDGVYWYLVDIEEARGWLESGISPELRGGTRAYQTLCDFCEALDPMEVLSRDELESGDWDGLCGVAGDIDTRVEGV